MKIDGSIISFRPNVPVSFYYANRTYSSGAIAETWNRFADGENSVFWVDFRTTFGNMAVQYLSLGVKDVCVLKTFYTPALYALLQSKDVVAIKGDDQTAIMPDGSPDPKNVNTYRLYSNVENVKELNRILSFKVIRLEQK